MPFMTQFPFLVAVLASPSYTAEMQPSHDYLNSVGDWLCALIYMYVCI